MRFELIDFKRNILYIILLSIISGAFYITLFLSRPDLLKIEMIYYLLMPLPPVFLLGYLMSQISIGKIIKPIKRVAETAESITHEDLSRRVKAENVSGEVQCLVKSFNDMISRLEAAFAYITESSSYIAHELKTPLAIMRGEAEVALKKERDKEEYKKVIIGSLEETRRMLKIIEDLLLLTRVNYRSDDLQMLPLDLSQFVEVLFEKAKILAERKNITVNFQVPETTVLVNADEPTLRRLFLNLIDNAIKYTPQDGRVDFIVRFEDERVKISIADTGIGIAQENLPKLFDKFFRIEEKIKDTGPSSGLGLSIAQSIAKLHQGEITVSSQIGKGTVFTVDLPRITGDISRAASK
ncbi:MAG: Sensor kinase CusS [Planctomycetes bacterium ADurb.Bin401]|jgi:heavy metal sensor kinase|nr:MAG: Sensor kinase CusS [Planctomycetes bacterium ADurb.Bin401]